MTFTPTHEQQAIISANLSPQCIIACAGSGKTATAVRRMLHIRKQPGCDRGYVALFSYTNVAVETFRREYNLLSSDVPDLSERVLISTVDSFITTNILLPHSGRVMGCSRQPFLVHGSEPFLNGFKVFNGEHYVGIEHLCVDLKNGSFIFTETSHHGQPRKLSDNEALEALRKFGETGAYTYNQARYWVVRTLREQKKLVNILALRYPYILVDEAQDISTMHGMLLREMQKAGSSISLIGDPNQAIFEFADADGSFLRDFNNEEKVTSQQITENRRSVQKIVDVANHISKANSKAVRNAPTGKCGAYYLKYKKENIQNVVQDFLTILEQHQYDKQNSAILCRGKDALKAISGTSNNIGQGSTEKFAYSSIFRDRQGDIAKAFEYALEGTFKLLNQPPATLRRDVLNGSSSEARILRRHIWRFLKNPDSGLPSASLPAKTEWQPLLKKNIATMLGQIEDATSFKRYDKWQYNLTIKMLDDAPLSISNNADNTSCSIKIQTVHQAKGAGFDAVLYVAISRDVTNLLAGLAKEEGRIGYVAVTRAKDILILAIPDDTKQSTIKGLERIGFEIW